MKFYRLLVSSKDMFLNGLNKRAQECMVSFVPSDLSHVNITCRYVLIAALDARILHSMKWIDQVKIESEICFCYWDLIGAVGPFAVVFHFSHQFVAKAFRYDWDPEDILTRLSHAICIKSISIKSIYRAATENSYHLHFGSRVEILTVIDVNVALLPIHEVIFNLEEFIVQVARVVLVVGN